MKLIYVLTLASVLKFFTNSFKSFCVRIFFKPSLALEPCGFSRVHLEEADGSSILFKCLWWSKFNTRPVSFTPVVWAE